jgi:hypothetical protein
MKQLNLALEKKRIECLMIELKMWMMHYRHQSFVIEHHLQLFLLVV